ncbi:MAG: hypothetical protein ACK46S_03550 [Bacteroidota bacterium]|jgi:hypothetical protein
MRKLILSSLLLLFCTLYSHAQLGEAKKDRLKELKLTYKKAPKIFTYGWSIIDDNGRAYLNVLLPKSFTANLIPFTFNYDVYMNKQMFFNLKTSFCNFKEGKIVNGETVESSNLLFALDLNTSVSLNSVYFVSELVDFRLLTGLGYTNRNIFVFNQSANLNLGGGVYIKFNKEFGMHLEMMAKFGLKAPLIKTNSNYMHSSIGFSYFIRSVKYSSRPRGN